MARLSRCSLESSVRPCTLLLLSTTDTPPSFTIVGPEYIAMMAGEAAHPRKNLKRAFKTIYLRFGLFFIGGALACGIVIPYNDINLINALNSSTGGSTAASSPYVIAMQNLGIGVLPHLTNALLVTSIFSAGNSYVLASHGSFIE